MTQLQGQILLWIVPKTEGEEPGSPRGSWSDWQLQGRFSSRSCRWCSGDITWAITYSRDTRFLSAVSKTPKTVVLQYLINKLKSLLVHQTFGNIRFSSDTCRTDGTTKTHHRGLPVSRLLTFTTTLIVPAFITTLIVSVQIFYLQPCQFFLKVVNQGLICMDLYLLSLDPIQSLLLFSHMLKAARSRRVGPWNWRFWL